MAQYGNVNRVIHFLIFHTFDLRYQGIVPISSREELEISLGYVKDTNKEGEDVVKVEEKGAMVYSQMKAEQRVEKTTEEMKLDLRPLDAEDLAEDFFK